MNNLRFETLQVHPDSIAKYKTGVDLRWKPVAFRQRLP